MKEIGYDPYRPIQPNGFSDMELDWISPELLIRRMSAPKEIAERNIILKDFESMIDKNFDNPKEMKNLINKVKSPSTKMQILFPSYRMLKT